MSKTVPSMLREAAETYEERNKLYGGNYKRFGDMMVSLFPKGVAIKTQEDWNRIGILIPIASKLGRYAEQFSNGGHDDSLLDISVYANMLRELDLDKKDTGNGD